MLFLNTFKTLEVLRKNLNADISRLSTNLKVEEKLAVSKENEKK